MKREFLQLAQKYDHLKHGFGSYYWSIKYDGMRAFWDGGITTGHHVPWTTEMSTGLWSRYMKPIFAPDWWLKTLPSIPLDGELWLGPGKFQEVMSICRRHVPDQRWKQIKFHVFDSPGLDTVFDFGYVNNAHTNVVIDAAVRAQLQAEAHILGVPWEKSKMFDPKQLPFQNLGEQTVAVQFGEWAPELMGTLLPELLDQGHEGIVLRKKHSIWLPERNTMLLKIKPWIDAEAKVVGCTFGRATDKGSKLLGMMGALTVNWDGIEFDLSGFTDRERELTGRDGMANARNIATKNPGESAFPNQIWPIEFPIGSIITFKYREVTNKGVPKDARYWRKLR